MTSTYNLDELAALEAAARPISGIFPSYVVRQQKRAASEFSMAARNHLPAMIADLRAYAKFKDRVQRGLNGPYPDHGLDDIATHAEKAGAALQAVGKATGSDWNNYEELPGIVLQMRADLRAAREMLRDVLSCIKQYGVDASGNPLRTVYHGETTEGVLDAANALLRRMGAK